MDGCGGLWCSNEGTVMLMLMAVVVVVVVVVVVGDATGNQSG